MLFPLMSARALAGKRDDAYRAGTIPNILINALVVEPKGTDCLLFILKEGVDYSA